jgi:hypothetical protein
LDLKNETGATQFHSSARVQKKSSMEFVQPFMAGDQLTEIADHNEIERMIDQLKRQH